MLLPPLRLTVGMGLAWWCALIGFLHTCRLAFTPKRDQRNVCLTDWESFSCILENSRHACHVPFTKDWLLSGPWCFCILPQICASRHPCLRGLQTVPLTSHLVCALTCTVGPGVCSSNSCPTNWIYHRLTPVRLQKHLKDDQWKQAAPELSFDLHGCERLWILMHMWVFWGFLSIICKNLLKKKPFFMLS